MGVVRLAFETNVASWKKIRSTGQIKAHYRRNGIPQQQQSFAAAATHRIIDEQWLGTVKFTYYEEDNTKRFKSYDDAIELGYSIRGGNFLELEQSLMPSDPTVSQLLDKCMDLYKNVLTHKRTNYQGIFWGIYYTVVHEDFADSSVRFTQIQQLAAAQEDQFIQEDMMAQIFDDIMKAYSTYNNVIIHAIFSKYRNNDLEL